MTTSRKKFLQQTGLAFAATMLPFSKLFSTELRRPLTIDTQHPKDCSQDLHNTLLGFDDDFIKEADFKYHKGDYPGIAKDILYRDEENVSACVDISDPNFPEKICDVTDHHIDDDISILYYHVYYPTSTYEDGTNGHDYETVPLPPFTKNTRGALLLGRDHNSKIF
ncbi:MAG TPA: hypothetical protein VGI61_07205 [Parafilimonas sp.]